MELRERRVGPALGRIDGCAKARELSAKVIDGMGLDEREMVMKRGKKRFDVWPTVWVWSWSMGCGVWCVVVGEKYGQGNVGMTKVG